MPDESKPWPSATGVDETTTISRRSPIEAVSDVEMMSPEEARMMEAARAGASHETPDKSNPNGARRPPPGKDQILIISPG